MVDRRANRFRSLALWVVTAASLLFVAMPITVRIVRAGQSDYLSGGGPIPASSAGEPSGNFRFICNASHFSYDDPIVHPGNPGASHLHMFFGNTATDAFSTYASLRATGDGSCDGGPLNRSGYWAPAVLDAGGTALGPYAISVYYKGNGPSAAAIATIRPMPAGLKMIAGYDPTDAEAGLAYHWMCENGQNQGATIPNCPVGVRVGAVVEFPSCWDGVNLDSPDHRSHMAYLDTSGGGRARCPGDHPVMLAQYTAGVWFDQRGGSASWRLSSDPVFGAAHGSTFHADWFGAWDPDVQAAWTRSCINAMRNCIGGELGDGRSLIGRIDPRPIVVPTIPNPMMSVISPNQPSVGLAQAIRLSLWSI